MIKFKLTILGTNAAGPGFGRITSCQALEVGGQIIVIDCGEACQIRLREYKIKTSKIDLICISHLHGDHIFGLPGLITSFGSNGRKAVLRIIGPKGIKAYLEDTLRHSSSHISYPIEFIELEHSTGSVNIYGSENLEIHAFPLDHRITTFGYRFQEKIGPGNIRKEAIDELGLSIDEIKQIKTGKDVKRSDGTTIKHEDCLKKRSLPRSYAYCSDTVYNLGIVPYIKHTQYLYHETTYAHELAHLALERKHTTATEAAQVAKEAEVEYLITGHYSGRYRTVDHLVEEAEKVFSNVIKGYDGVMIDFKKPLQKREE